MLRNILLLATVLISCQLLAQKKPKGFCLDTILCPAFGYPAESEYDLFPIRTSYNQDGYFTIFRRSSPKGWGIADTITVFYLSEVNNSLHKVYLPFIEDSNAVETGAMTLGAAYKDHFYIYYNEIVYDYKVDLGRCTASLAGTARVPMIFDHFRCNAEGYLLLYNNYPVTDADSGNFSILVLNPQLDSIVYEDMSAVMHTPYLYFSGSFLDYDTPGQRILFMKAEEYGIYQKQSGQPLTKVAGFKKDDWKQFNSTVSDSLFHQVWHSEITPGFVMADYKNINRYDHIKIFRRWSGDTALVVYNAADSIGGCRDVVELVSLKKKKILSSYTYSTKVACVEAGIINKETYPVRVFSGLDETCAIGRFKSIQLSIYPESFGSGFLSRNIPKSEYEQAFLDIYTQDDMKFKLLIYSNAFFK